MRRIPLDVLNSELNLTWQGIFTWASWAIALAMIALSIVMWRKQRTPFYVITLLAVGVGAFAEPLYDVAFDLWFYDVHDGRAGAMWSTFTAFDVIQPNWAHSGYIILYGAMAIYAGKRMYEGTLSHRTVWLIWGAEILTSVVFEVVATSNDVYAYFGPYELRVVEYPLVIGVLEGTQTLLFTVLAVNIWRFSKSNLGLLSLFVAFPMTFFGVNFGVGAPLIIALHLSPGEFSSELVWAATLLVMAFCALAVKGATNFLPKPPAHVVPVVSSDVRDGVSV
jgi:hypothetical protein